MHKYAIILISLSLMTLSACSKTKPAPPELKVVTEYIKAEPPKLLTNECADPETRDIVVNRDLVLSRQDYIAAYQKCKALQKNLADWVKAPLPVNPLAEQKSK